MNTHRTPSIRAVLWDLGGVILRTFDSEGRRAWEQRLGLPRNGLARLVFEGEAGRQASVGRASTEDVWTWVLGQLKLPEESRGRLVSDFWKGDRVDEALVDYIRSLRSRVKTALITNAWPGTRQTLEERWGIADAFDLVVISSEVGTTKPGRRIYELALDRLGVRPDEALLVDDFAENITGAESVGMHGVLFRSPEQAMADVARLVDGIESRRPSVEQAVDPS
jgi:epoxide hydrolase-like predicted phosphatase